MPKPFAANGLIQSLRAVLPSRADSFWFAALAGVLMILLHESLFQGKGLVAADGLLQFPPWNQTNAPSNALLSDQCFVFLPTQEFVHAQKSFPLWNPYLCCGVPNLGAIQGALLFPIRLMLAPLDPFTASGIGAFLKLCLAGWFMMIYLRLLGASGAAAFLSGMVFSLSGFMIVWLGHPQVNCAMWLPLLLVFVEKSFRAGPGNEGAAKALRAWAGFAITYACMILGGHPPTVVQISIVIGIYFLFRCAERGPRNSGRQVWMMAGAVVAGVLLAAPQLLPFLEYFQQSSSTAASAGVNRASENVSFVSLIHFLLPNIFGSPARGFEDLIKLLDWRSTLNYCERTQYLGIVPLFLAAYGVARWQRISKFFTFLILGSLAVATGLPPFPIIIGAFPVLKDINQMRLLLFVGFGVAVLAGWGWDEFCKRSSARRNAIFAAGFCVAVGLPSVVLIHHARPFLKALDPAHGAFFQRQMFMLAGGILCALFLALSPARFAGGMAKWVALGWTAVDLLTFGTGFNPSISRDRYYPETPAIQWLKKDPSIFRIFGAGFVLIPNSAEIYGLSDARGRDYMTVRRYEELITGRAGEFFFYGYADKIPNTLPLLNAKYLLAERGLSLNTNRYELAYSNEICIYRFKEWRERALLVHDFKVEPDRAAVFTNVSAPGFDPGKVLLLEESPEGKANEEGTDGTNRTDTARITKYEPDYVAISVDSTRPGYLLLLDTYFPGWSATVNGGAATILRADYNFRAVAVPSGKCEVHFSYFPASFRAGLCLFGLGVVVVLLAFWQPWFRRREPVA